MKSARWFVLFVTGLVMAAVAPATISQAAVTPYTDIKGSISCQQFSGYKLKSWSWAKLILGSSPVRNDYNMCVYVSTKKTHGKYRVLTVARTNHTTAVKVQVNSYIQTGKGGRTLKSYSVTKNITYGHSNMVSFTAAPKQYVCGYMNVSPEKQIMTTGNCSKLPA